jgi:hydroxymethylbilane synthase
VLRVATRGSRLARWQAEHVVALLGVPGELVIVATEGDRRQDVPLHEIGGQGVFVKDVQRALLDGRADIAVHSAKDLPSTEAPGLVIAAVPPRGDARDALVGASLAGLPAGATVATGAVRRRAQLAALRPDLRFAPLRGNIETRLAKASAFDAIVVALAALDRLGLADAAAEVLDRALCVPQVGQGALAVECRAGDAATIGALREIDDARSHRAVEAERAFLAMLGGGCDLPCGAHATVGPGGAIELDAVLASLDGATVLRAHAEGTDPATVGREAARDILGAAGGPELAGVRR